MNAKYGTQLDTKIIDALLERDKEEIRQQQKAQANGITRFNNPIKQT